MEMAVSIGGPRSKSNKRENRDSDLRVCRGKAIVTGGRGRSKERRERADVNDLSETHDGLVPQKTERFVSRKHARKSIEEYGEMSGHIP